MATAYTKRDVNRFSKTYRYVRQATRLEYQIPEIVIDPSIETSSTIESRTLSFEGGDTVRFDFEKTYASPPYVFVGAATDGTHLFVESIGLTSATIRSSAETNGLAHVHVISSIQGDGTRNPVLGYAKKIDASRFAKIFPYLRTRLPSYNYRIGFDEISSVNVEPPETERSIQSFAGSSEITYTFTRYYGDTPADTPLVVVTPNDSVNVYVYSVTTTEAVIRSSTETDASVMIQVFPVTD